MEFVTLLTTLSKVLITYGPSALGWIVSAVLGWYIVKKKKDELDEISTVQTKLLETKDEYLQKVEDMNERLGELNQKHADIVSHISERRVEDLKELTDDYNKLATNTLRTLDRFVVAIEVSNDFKKSRKLSEDNDD
jgi:uncharacterized membrane-anchored protein YhcB (DUF1043 family)